MDKGDIFQQNQLGVHLSTSAGRGGFIAHLIRIGMPSCNGEGVPFSPVQPSVPNLIPSATVDNMVDCTGGFLHRFGLVTGLESLSLGR
jgi:hypothetical protein